MNNYLNGSGDVYVNSPFVCGCYNLTTTCVDTIQVMQFNFLGVIKFTFFSEQMFDFATGRILNLTTRDNYV